MHRKRIIKDTIHPESYGDDVDLFPKTSIDQVVGSNRGEKDLESRLKQLDESVVQVDDIKTVVAEHGERLDKAEEDIATNKSHLSGHDNEINHIIEEIGILDDDMTLVKQGYDELKVDKMDKMVVVTSTSQRVIDGTQVPDFSVAQIHQIHNAFVANKLVKIVSTTLYGEYYPIVEHDFTDSLITFRFLLGDDYIITYQVDGDNITATKKIIGGDTQLHLYKHVIGFNLSTSTRPKVVFTVYSSYSAPFENYNDFRSIFTGTYLGYVDYHDSGEFRRQYPSTVSLGNAFIDICNYHDDFTRTRLTELDDFYDSVKEV